MAQERLPFGAEDQVAVGLGEEQRANAEAVAREEQLARLSIPDRDREVAVEAVEAPRSPLLVRVSDDLGVGRRREHVPERAQLVLQLDVVVDLAVLHDPVPAILGRERLVASLEVDDRETRVRHPEAPVEVEPDAVGTAVLQLARHGEEEVRRGVTPLPGVDARDSAHRWPLSQDMDEPLVGQRDPADAAAGSAQGASRSADTVLALPCPTFEEPWNPTRSRETSASSSR